MYENNCMKFSAHKNCFVLFFSCHNEYEAFINNVWTSKLHDSTIFNFSAQFCQTITLLLASLAWRCTETCGFFAKLINVALHETLSLIKGEKKKCFEMEEKRWNISWCAEGQSISSSDDGARRILPRLSRKALIRIHSWSFGASIWIILINTISCHSSISHTKNQL